MRVKLICGPDGSPNFCFGLYTGRGLNSGGGECVEFIQSDWGYAYLASKLGWVPCTKCGATDGTVACLHRTVSEMLAEAYDYLAVRDGRLFNWEEYD